MNKTLQDFSKISKQEIIDGLKADKGNAVVNYIEEDFGTNLYIGLKDIHMQTLVPTTSASHILENQIGSYNSEVVSRLLAAGFNPVATLNMDEFAMGGSNKNSYFGSVDNALDPDNIPGGSSGGSAYAVAKGLLPAATGTDTGGSIRQPASLNGIYGYKPTYGLISRYGTIGFGSSFDTMGVLANDLDDAKLISAAMIGEDPKDNTSYVPAGFSLDAEAINDLNGKRIAIIKEFSELECDDETNSEYKRAIEWFISKGAKIVEHSIPTVKLALELYIAIAYAEGASNLNRFDGIRYGTQTDDHVPFITTRHLFGSEVKKRIVLGSLLLSGEKSSEVFEHAQKVRQKMKAQFVEVYKTCDYIIAPSNSMSTIGKSQDTNSYKFYSSDILLIPANLTGMPSLTIPLKPAGSSNPVGLQLMANRFEDGKLFSLAKFAEGKING
ncbi:amidase family protein [Mollicutes bacterium LVI A0039]|nr:amidase family protein [Mollicutes bacterium LVI A0039]